MKTRTRHGHSGHGTDRSSAHDRRSGARSVEPRASLVTKNALVLSQHARSAAAERSVPCPLCPCCVRVFMSVEAFFVYLLLGNARPAAQNDVCRHPEFPLISFADHCLTERDKKRRGPSPPPHVLHVIRNRRQVPNGSQLVGRLRALHSSCGIGMRCGTWPPGTPGSMVPSKL
jgi:hypothetical protein